MRQALADFDGYSVPAEHADRIRRSVCSRALFHVALDKMSAASPDGRADEPNDVEIRSALAVATASLQKAYDVYPFPFYLYDLAGLRELGGALLEALRLYERFLDELNALRPDTVDAALLQERNPEPETSQARERIISLRKQLRLSSGKPWWKVW